MQANTHKSNKKAGRNNRGTGSFCIPRRAVEILLQTEERAKWLIPAYLKLAAHTDRSGLYSTAGHTSVRKVLRRNKQDAQRFIFELSELLLIDSAEYWTDLTGEVFPDDVPDRQKVRYVLNDFDEEQSDMLWFSRGLVDGVGEFKNPLRRLADCGAAGARMFLYLYSEYDVHSFHAFNPNTTIFKKYTPGGDEWKTNYMIKGWIPDDLHMKPHVVKKVFPYIRDWDVLEDPEQWEVMRSHWEAVYNLEAAGFIYPVVSIVNCPIKVTNPQEHTGFDDDGDHIPKSWDYVGMKDMGVVYELANLDRYATDTGDLHEAIKNVIQKMHGNIEPSHVYSILPTGSNHSVMGLYKPRFIPDNIKNAFVAECIKTREEDREQARRWLNHFKVTKGLQPKKEFIGLII